MSSPQEPQLFVTTRWSVVLAAGGAATADARAALERLCQTYWYPLYCCVRQRGHAPADAQDLTQAFFAHLLGKDLAAKADPDRGRFRSFLRTSLENFLRQQHRNATTQRKGGGQELVSWDAAQAEERFRAEPASGGALDEGFDRQWAEAVLGQALERLRTEFAENSRVDLFDALEPHLWGDATATAHADIAERLGLSAVAVRVTLHRLRRRFKELLVREIEDTLEDPAEAPAELQSLRRILAGTRKAETFQSPGG